MPIGLELDMERGNLAQLKVVGVGAARAITLSTV